MAEKATVIIRKSTQDDLSRISEFIKQFVESGDLLPRTFDELEGLLGNFFIAVDSADNTILGCAALDIYNRKLAEIRSLAVSPTAQGRGVGRQLVQACVDLAREKEVYEIMAISAEDDFFKACGFDYTLPNLRRAFFIQTRDDL